MRTLRVRKTEIEKFVKDCLAMKPEWNSLESFAPNVRGSIAFVKTTSESAAENFIKEWRQQNFVFKGSSIRAREDKPPQKRKSDGKIYAMAAYMNEKHNNAEFDKDLKKACVWHGDVQLVKWDGEAEQFIWDEGVVASLGIDKNAAEAYTNQ